MSATEPAARGPVRRSPRSARPPARRSGVGPLVFLVVVVGLLVGVVLLAQPLVVDAIAGMSEERVGLLKQPFVRMLVASRVEDGIDRAADATGTLRNFAVPRGATAAQIGRDLQDQGFVSSGFAFVYLLYETGRENALQSGTYRISSAMTPRELAKIFERAPGEQTVLKIIEGWRLSEIAKAVSDAFPSISRDAFLSAAVVGARTNAVLVGLDPKTSLEGFLFPDTYFFRPDAKAEDVVTTLIETFEQRVGATLRAAAAAQKTTVRELVKLASIVEREARVRTESPTIAGVYANRLRIGMKLDADPTIQYALGEWRELLLPDLKLDSPYNTYLVAGLPPSPICSPGQAALEGAAKPATHDFLYFVARGDGTHVFSKTLEEHEANRVRVGNR